MIVFTIKNSRNDTVYVGTTKDTIDERWALLQLAKDSDLEGALYTDMRHYGVACFTIEEYDYAETREELADMFQEAMAQYNGVSLKGMKTTLPRTAVYVTSEGREIETRIPNVTKSKVKKPASESDQKALKAELSANKEKLSVAKAENGVSRASGAVAVTRQSSITPRIDNTASVRKRVQPDEDLSALKVKPKLATGRTGSAAKEKRIKEALALEKQEREALKKRQILEQADEMKAILANLDARGSTLRKRF